MATFVCRVQFLDDTDPFNSTNFPEPTRPPVYTFREDIPLINQIAGVHRLLKAPHKVRRPLVNHESKTIRNSTCYWYFPDCFCCAPTSKLTFFHFWARWDKHNIPTIHRLFWAGMEAAAAHKWLALQTEDRQKVANVCLRGHSDIKYGLVSSGFILI